MCASLFDASGTSGIQYHLQSIKYSCHITNPESDQTFRSITENIGDKGTC